MLESIIGLVLKGLSGPFLDAYKAKLASGVSHDTLAQGLSLRELELQQREAELLNEHKIAIVGKWYVPEKIMCYVVTAYFTQLVVYDKMLGGWTHHATDPLTGWAAVAAGMVLTYMFSKRTVNEAIKLWKQ